MDFGNTTIINEQTELTVSRLLREKYEEIENSNQYWKFEEQEEILQACKDLGLTELKTELEILQEQLVSLEKQYDELIHSMRANEFLTEVIKKSIKEQNNKEEE